jgi:NAD(P)-dependent dehydrogenase (short-subunit alcohol dehydrogenase family)
MSKTALPHLLATRGAIVNTASTAGTHAQPWSSAYSASKGGVIALTQTMAVSNGMQGVRVNCVAPGGVETPIAEQFSPPEGVDLAIMGRIMPFERMGSPDELAAAFAFLASSEASYINGITIRVDGAMKA